MPCVALEGCRLLSSASSDKKVDGSARPAGDATTDDAPPPPADADAAVDAEAAEAAAKAAKEARVSKVKDFLKVSKTVLRGVFGMKPTAEEVAATPKKEVKLNTTGSAVMVADSKPGRWDRITATLVNTPLIQVLLEGARKLKESEVGQAAKQVKVKLDDSKEALREKWETSQHPYVTVPAPAMMNVSPTAVSRRLCSGCCRVP